MINDSCFVNREENTIGTIKDSNNKGKSK